MLNRELSELCKLKRQLLKSSELKDIEISEKTDKIASRILMYSVYCFVPKLI